MSDRLVRALLWGGALLAAAAQAAAQPVVTVQDLELEVGPERERLRVSADAPLEAELTEVDARTLMLALPGARLGTSAPTRIAPVAQGAVRRVTAFERGAAAGRPEVRVVVQRRPGAPARLLRSAGFVALDFEPLRAGAPPPPDDRVSIAYRRAPLERVVREIARATGETFVFDQAVAGQVTIEGPTTTTRGEAIALLDSLLLLHNLAAVPAPGGARKIVPIHGAPGPWVSALPEGDEAVATLLRVESVKADDLFAAISSFFGEQTTGVVFPPTNSLILAGPASLLRRVRSAVEALDELDLSPPLVWRLQHASADTVAEQLIDVLGDRALPFVSAEPATNALLLRLRPDDVERARRLVDRLDRPEQGRGGLHVFRLRYADPVALSERLTALRDAEPAAEGGAALGPLQGRDFALAADPATHSLLVQAHPSDLGPLLDVVREIDRVPDSVMVELTVASVVLDGRLDIGIDWLIPSLTTPRQASDALVTIASTSGGPLSTTPSADRPFLFGYTRSPLLIPIVNPLTGLPDVLRIPRESLTLSLNGREVRTETLMQPRLLITSGEEHEIFAGDNVPIPIAQTEDTSAAIEVRQNIERQDVGTRVRLAPTLGTAGNVRLEIELEQSSLAASAAGPAARVGPTIRKTEIQSVLQLRPGETAVLATHGEPLTTRSEVGVPWLKDVPWLGVLFRTTREETRTRHLLFAVRAEVVGSERRELARALGRALERVDAAAATADR